MSAFEAAVQWVATAAIPTSNQTKLQLYALYKVATASPTPSGSRPGLLDFSGRAKWDAWNSLGKTGDYDGHPGVDKAKLDYVREATSLGFKSDDRDGSDLEPRRVEKKEQAVSVSQIKDDFVDEAPPSKLHDLALDGDTERLEAFLSCSEADSIQIDQRDSYGYSALHLATDRGRLGIVKILLAHGADKTAKDEDGNTPLDLARLAEHESLVALLS